MKLLLILAATLMLTACASQPKCVRVAYYDYGNVGCLQHIYQFQGKYYPGNLGNNKGMIIADKYLGDGNASMFEQCTDPADLSGGWYSVLIDEGMGTWVLTGEGYRGVVDVLPNSIVQKSLFRIVTEVKP
jgi:hypothetical protein